MDRNRIRFLTISVILGVLYLALSFLVYLDIFRKVDYESMVWLQSILSRTVDIPFSLITLAGSAEIVSVILMGIFIYILLAWKRLFLGLGLYFLIFIIEIFGKIFVYHPVPPSIFHRYALNFSMPSGSFIDTSFSFPSGHIARVVFLGVIFLFLILYSKVTDRNKALSSLLIGVLTLVVFVSRIYLGEHWFSDVLGGLILGGSIATLAISFW